MNTTVLSGSHTCKSLSLTENNANSGTIFNTKSTLLIIDVGNAGNFVLIEKKPNKHNENPRLACHSF